MGQAITISTLLLILHAAFLGALVVFAQGRREAGRPYGAALTQIVVSWVALGGLVLWLAS